MQQGVARTQLARCCTTHVRKDAKSSTRQSKNQDINKRHSTHLSTVSVEDAYVGKILAASLQESRKKMPIAQN